MSRALPFVLVAVLLSLGGVSAAHAQTGTVRVQVLDAGLAVAGATVISGTQQSTTDGSGIAILTLPAGTVAVVATKEGYKPSAGRVTVVAGEERAMKLTIGPLPMAHEGVTAVTSTRNNRRLEDQALPVQVTSRTPIDQLMLMTPGNIGTLLDGMPSLRMQNTSPELGLEAARMRGLRSKYTRLLSDGVALNFDHPGGLAAMQIWPIDIGQVEVLPDGASPLFGANALAGAVNLVARRPGLVREREFLFSQSLEGGTDASFWWSSPSRGNWSSTWAVDAHLQDERDRDDDGWSDIAGYNRGGFATQVFWDNKRGRAASGRARVTFEKREGGSEFAHQQLETKTADGALFGHMPLGRFILAGAGTLYVQSHTRDFSDERQHERRESATMELTLRGATARHTWIAGIESDWFALRSHDLTTATYVSTRPGIFLQDDWDIKRWLVVSGSARIDYHNIYDLVFSPRGSLLLHGRGWSTRLSAGQSYFAPFPPPFTEETEAAGYSRLTIQEPLEMEQARSISWDFTYGTGPTAFTISWFRTDIENPALVDRNTFTLYTDEDPIETHGVELIGNVRKGLFALGGNYSYLQARERGDIEVALTPTHSAGFSAMVGAAGKGHGGVQVQYTGEQRLDANPYRSTSEPYTVVNLLGAVPLGRLTFFANAENLGNVHQTHWDPIARPSRDIDGRWTVDAWAPLRGRVINFGLRVSF